jgi:hypothetical protein
VRRSLDDQESPPALPELAQGQGRNREEVQCYGCLLHRDLFSVGAHVNVTGSERVLFLVYIFFSDEVNICNGMHACIDACSW